MDEDRDEPLRREGDDAADEAVRVRVTHLRSVPDPLRLLRFEEAPELGPRVLFFSGGTALRKTARAIKRYTHNSIHLITPFDSGGSSAKLRAAFSMPAVGDIRNRLMALADESLRGNPEIYDLFAFRFPEQEDASALRARLDTMIERKDALVSRVPDPMRKIIRTHLRHFRDEMPEGFDLRGASVGNLILTGGYLNNERRLDPVIYMFSMLVKARGVVRPICNQHLHLAATLADGTRALGQHVLTARGAAGPGSRIVDLSLCDSLDRGAPARAWIRRKTRKLIAQADLIVFPMGSFYTSVVANLLPEGVGAEVAANPCPKVYVPNAGEDPEEVGLTVAGAAETLVRYLRRGAGEAASRPVSDFLNYVLVDSRGAGYGRRLDPEGVRALGADVIDAPLTTPNSRPRLDAERVARALLSLA